MKATMLVTIVFVGDEGCEGRTVVVTCGDADEVPARQHTRSSQRVLQQRSGLDVLIRLSLFMGGNMTTNT